MATTNGWSQGRPHEAFSAWRVEETRGVAPVPPVCPGCGQSAPPGTYPPSLEDYVARSWWCMPCLTRRLHLILEGDPARLRVCAHCSFTLDECRPHWPEGRKCCPDCTHALRRRRLAS